MRVVRMKKLFDIDSSELVRRRRRRRLFLLIKVFKGFSGQVSGFRVRVIAGHFSYARNKRNQT